VYRRVLLSYDGSRASRDALKQVGDLVATLNCETHVLLVSDVAHRAASQGLAVETLCDAERSACEAILNEGLEWLRQRGVDATTHVELGSPIEVIPRIARELSVDLVVVGHIPRTRFARWWAGPENVSLLDRVHCSVLVALG
jgi:nucleotide-binding universal stress UspA family protein